MSGDLQTRKRRGKAKKKAHLEALQREEYEQERLVLNTLAYEAEDEIINGKTKPVVNNSHKSSGGGGGSSNGSGLVAKIIFLILLVSLSIVIGLILIELRAGMETASVVPKAEVQPEPEIPTPSLHVEEPGPEPPSVAEPEIEDDFEPLEATPPLEEYIRVVEKEEEPVEEEVVEVVEDIPVEIVEEVVDEAVAPLEDSEAVEEVETEEEVAPVEIEEPAHVEEAEELAPVEEAVSEEVESPAAVEEVQEPAAVEVVEEQAVPEEVEELAAIEEVEELPPIEVEEPAAIEEVEELPPVEVEEPVAVEAEVQAVEELEAPAAVLEEIEESVVTEEKEPAVAEEVEEAAVAEEVVEEPPVAEALVGEPAATEEVVEAPADVVEEVEEPAAVEEVGEPAAEEVEEPAAVAEEVAAPVEEAPAVPVEEEPVQVEEVAEEPVISETVEEVQAPLEVKEEAEEEEDPEDDEDKDDDEIDEPKIVLPPPEEDDDEDWSQYGREGGAEDLAQAYLRVESLAEEVLRLDPGNSMVNHVAPHLSGVLKAMEEGHTEGILDTLNHIQIILEDVKNRIGDSQNTPEPAEPEAQIDVDVPSVEAELEAASAPVVEAPVETAEPVVEAMPELVEEAVSEPILEAVPEPVLEAEPEPVLEAEPEPVLEAEPEPVVEAVAIPSAEALEPVAEVSAVSEGTEAGEPSAEAEVPMEILHGASQSINEEHPIPVQEEKERAFPVDDDVPEDVLDNIEEQIVPHEEAAAVEEEDIPIPPVTETDTVSSPEVEEKKEGGEPVPVEEVIPDPIYIQPLQGDSEAPVEGTADAKSMYGKADITSDVDYEIREELDAAEKVISKNLREALTTFGSILQNNPKSARALYGRALCLDRLAEDEQSNSKLEQAIVTYRGVIDLADEDPSLVPLPLLRLAAEKCIDRMRFRGFFGKAVRVQQRLLQRFPDDLALRNQMGVTYLLMHQPSAAKEVFEAILEKWPEDGFAQVHYGFILKTTDQNNTGGAEYMKKGIESKAEGTQDGRFFLHLGDALQREGQTEEAYKVYDDAVAKGLFLNKYQRSLYNVDRLSSQPIWTVEQTTYTEFFRKLEANWETIRDEAVALLTEPPQDGFRPESENLQARGDWKQYEMFSRGRKITANCVKAKVTCSLIEYFLPAAGCKRGQVKFSVMDPDTHVHAHTGPTNCRLRAHLGLVVPSGVHLRVADQMVSWEEGKIIVFDDSWEHEVWHNGTTKRLVLIVDVWHPELTDYEKKSLSPL
ncbi:aspartyl/asparaginyl beta-hydroxylase-like isoform X2 [Macrobrachium rosenbergii]|uniref:aspartyl/asparaginyl beta-hydroxylase-like isoform X2 n=1 Tax=Macrobrachium rosenbergii TaxID=79674 RepID=UPI0034D6F6F9